MPTDKLNREIHVGSFVVYGHLLGRCAALRIGKVLAIKPRKQRWSSQEDDTFTVTVIGVDDERFLHETVKLCSKPGHLLYPDRIMVIDRSELLDEYVTLLDGYNAS